MSGPAEGKAAARAVIGLLRSPFAFVRRTCPLRTKSPLRGESAVEWKGATVQWCKSCAGEPEVSPSGELRFSLRGEKIVSVEFKNDALKQYYGLFRDDKENNGATANAASTNGATADDGVINENLQYDIKDGVDEVTISFKISNYSCDNLRFTMVEGGKYLVVSGLREDKQSNNKYKFEINFRMDPAISSDTIEATYEEDESIVTIVAKSKIMHVGCSRN